MAFLNELEPTAEGEVIFTAAVFLTNRECPWKCLMCDLWKNTLPGPTPLGAIPAQIDFALARLKPARQIKLYNSGSFFDRQAVPPADYPAIIRRLAGFERVIVECHPALVSDSCREFQQRLGRTLEVAIGLETIHPRALAQLNKQMSADDYAAAADRLRQWGIASRAFALIQPPFVPPDESLHWATESARFAFQCGAAAVSLIPTRPGNGALDRLAETGEFSPPSFELIETVQEDCLRLGLGRVFIDTWDLPQFATCPVCRSDRVARVAEMNLRQTALPAVVCPACHADR